MPAVQNKVKIIYARVPCVGVMSSIKSVSVCPIPGRSQPELWFISSDGNTASVSPLMAD